MVEIKLPCAVGSMVEDVDDGFRGYILSYKIIGNGNPIDTRHTALAEVQDPDDRDNQRLIRVSNGVFPDNINILWM